MILDYVVYFKQALPPFEDLLLKLQKHTELDLIYNENEETIINPYSSTDIVSVYYDEISKCIIIVGPGLGRYLMAATLCTLIDLGGTYDGKIPLLGKLRYSETYGRY